MSDTSLCLRGQSPASQHNEVLMREERHCPQSKSLCISHNLMDFVRVRGYRGYSIPDPCTQKSPALEPLNIRQVQCNAKRQCHHVA